MKTWQKPQLIVLVRSNPEEALMGACKTPVFGTTPADVFDGCAAKSGEPCVACDSITES